MKKNRMLALLLILALVLCGCSGEKEEAFRMIQVLEVSGSVTVERQTMGAMEAYEGMRLESGDKITVGSDSWLKMKMDEDKYALVEPNSVLRLEASGSSADSKTVLHLEAGAVSNRLESALSEASIYEVSTPNSTMAVRGTVFRVEITWNEEGDVSVANIAVYEGKLSSRLVYPDGAVDGEGRAVLITDGTQAQVWGNDILSKYVTTDTKLELGSLKLKTLEFLQEAYDSGKDLKVSPEELKELIAALEQSPDPTESSTEPVKETTSPTEETTEPTTEPTTAPTTAPTNPPATKAPDPDDSGDSGDSGDDDDSSEEEETTQATKPANYTVTFLFNGSVFATQTVPSGETAEIPTLMPAQSGNWDFNFSTAITQNTKIFWG